MKVLFIITGLQYGGAERQMVQLALTLKERGWDAKVLSLLPPDGYASSLIKSGIEVVSLEMRRGRAGPIDLIRAVRAASAYSPQIMIGFMFHANLLARLVGKIIGVPVIITSIRTEAYWSPWIRLAERATGWMSDLTVFNSASVANRFTSDGIVNPRKVRVIPNGIEVERFACGEARRAELRKRYGFDPRHFVWVAIGNLVEAKDYPNLLAAFEKMTGKEDAILVIAGRGDKYIDLTEERRRLGLEERVMFKGFVEKPEELLCAGDAFVLSSAWEGLPNSILEACAAGKPVVATDVGGVGQLIKAAGNGFIVRKRDPEALATAMREMMELSEEQREEMGRRGRDHIRDNYSVEKVAEMWERLCMETYAEKKAASW